MTNIDYAFKIINQSAGKLQFLYKDNPAPFMKDFMPQLREAYENEIIRNLELLKSKLKEVDVNESNGMRLTLLGCAAESGWLEVVKYLVEEKGANVNKEYSKGKTPLHEAAQRNIDVVLYLIERGAEVNHVDKNGRTPLHVAAEHLGQFAKRKVSSGFCVFGPFRQIDIIQNLLAAGAKIQKDKEGKTPLDLTDKSDAVEGLQLLMTATLLNDTRAEKPKSIKENIDLSAQWDAEVLKINYLLENPIMGCKEQRPKILNEIFLYKKDSLLGLAGTQFFKLMNTDAIKNKISSEPSQLRLKIN